MTIQFVWFFPVTIGKETLLVFLMVFLIAPSALLNATVAALPPSGKLMMPIHVAMTRLTHVPIVI
jgi:hypothetical protein